MMIATNNCFLQMPKFEFRSNAKPSAFAYASPLEEKKGRETEKVETAVLSTTAKAKAKEIRRERRKASNAGKEEKMDVVSLLSFESPALLVCVFSLFVSIFCQIKFC